MPWTTSGRSPDPAADASARFRLACWTLWRRELVRFVRQKSRVVGALGTPVVFWVLVGSGLGRSMNLPGPGGPMSYLEFSFPGALASILMFTAIFSTISIIEDRREGFMQGVLVAPVSRAAIALGKVLGATTLAVGQACLFMCLGPLAGIRPGALALGASVAAMILIAFALTSLGFWIAWRMESTQGFHAVMNLCLMPMLVLSGAFFPASGSSKWLQWVIAVNPMSYAVALLRSALYCDSPAAGPIPGPGWEHGILVSILFAAIMFIVLIRSVTREADRAIA